MTTKPRGGGKGFSGRTTKKKNFFAASPTNDIMMFKAVDGNVGGHVGGAGAALCRPVLLHRLRRRVWNLYKKIFEGRNYFYEVF